MKNPILAIALILGILFSFQVHAQKKGKTESSQPATTSKHQDKGFDKQMKMGKIALKYQDPTPLKMAYYHALATYPDSTNYLDSLAILYFSTGQYQQCILVSREVLSERPENLPILEIKAVSEKTLGLAKMSLEDYEKLFPATNNIQHLYQIASLQFELKRLGECQNSIKGILAREDLKDAKVTVFFGQGQSQDVSMESAVYNMAGVILLELNDPENAKSMFDKAIELEADFVLAKNNRLLIDKQEEAAKNKKE